MTAALIASGCCNIALGGALWKCAYQRPSMRLAQWAPEGEIIVGENCAMLEEMSHWEYARLLAELSNRELACDGFTRAGLALSILIGRFDFDIDRALLGRNLQRRNYRRDGEDAKNALYYTLVAGLTPKDFEEIQHFGRQERWPMTERGIFHLMRDGARARENQGDLAGVDPTLVESFFASGAFCSFARLFPTDLPRQYLATAALDLDWSDLSQVGTSTSGESARASRSRLLLKAIERGSKPAAYLLITSDFDFALREISDESMRQLLALIDTYTAEAMAITMGVIRGIRGDAVRELAAKQVCHFLNLPPPNGETQWGQLACALAQQPLEPKRVHAIGQLLSEGAKEKGAVIALQTASKHVVQPGDTLWRLSKIYGLSVRDLMRRNGLSCDYLHIGQILRLDLTAAHI